MCNTEYCSTVYYTLRWCGSKDLDQFQNVEESCSSSFKIKCSNVQEERQEREFDRQSFSGDVESLLGRRINQLDR
jgi:hypothetical protein